MLVSYDAVQAADLTIDTNTTINGLVSRTTVNIVEGANPPTVVHVVDAMGLEGCALRSCARK